MKAYDSLSSLAIVSVSLKWVMTLAGSSLFIVARDSLECINCGFKKIWSDLMVSIHCSYLNGMYVPMCVNAGVNHWGGITTAHLSSVEWCWIFHGIFEDQCSLMSRWSGVYTHVGGRQRVTCPYYG
ncbi:uncharacterized protein [Dysidea avara]|uniref:uncharacterized protein isoform X2 n=1 Tax=Dysidea avara TaxID=196820 RepID=UPI00332106A0